MTFLYVIQCTIVKDTLHQCAEEDILSSKVYWLLQKINKLEKN